MAARCPYVTEYRRTRDRTYVTRMRRSALYALLVHLVLVAASAPFRQQIPLVRHIGHEGPLRLLPEISVERDVGETETEEESARGLGAESFFKVVDTRLVTDDVVPEEEPHIESGDYEQDFGDELLHLLEQSLPQPTSRDVVLVKFVKPAYPPLSIAEGTEGVVEFRVHVTSRGRVAQAWLLSSEVDERMESSARRALMQWRFRPHVSGGVSVDFLVDQRIRFRLNEVLGGTAVGTGIR
jgi:TonB family protein